jgi:hypothetical protein
MKNKAEGKVKQKRSSKSRNKDVPPHQQQQPQCDIKSQDRLNEIALKNQQSAFVKEKIKSIFEERINHIEDGEKKTFITLKPRQELEMPVIENRISVIRSVSSFLQTEHNICNPTSFQYMSEQLVNM